MNQVELLPIDTNEDGIDVVSTVDFAEGLSIQHKNLLDTVRGYQSVIERDFGRVAFQTRPFETAGGMQQREIALLTEDQALFVGSLSRNSERVIEFKSLLVRSFAAARRRHEGSVLINPSTISRREMALMIIEAEDRIERLNLEVAERGRVIIQQAKKAAYVDEVLTADNCWLTTTVAKELGMSAIGLNELLHELGVQYEVDDHWVLYHQYQNKGYTKTRTHTFAGKDTKMRTSLTTVWTELGRAFVIRKITSHRKKLEDAVSQKQITDGSHSND